jgi:hypothetical protein
MIAMTTRSSTKVKARALEKVVVGKPGDKNLMTTVLLPLNCFPGNS